MCDGLNENPTESLLMGRGIKYRLTYYIGYI